MQTLHKVLHSDANAFTKQHLADLLRGVHHAITPAVYEKVSGLDPNTELDKLRKAELVSIVEDLRDHYDVSWESGLDRLDGNMLDVFRGVMREVDLLWDAGFDAQDATDADFAAELGSIDFATLIGGPMDAAVRAQTNASVSTIDFIQSVGFEGEGADRKVRMVEFKYVGTKTDDQGNTVPDPIEIKVPFIAMLNVPALRIESLEIDLNVKLNSTATKNVSTTVGVNASGGYRFGPVKMNVAVAVRRSNVEGQKIEKEYSMNVKVRATNDEMPAGLERVLGLMAA